MALVNARSLVNKTFILQDFFNLNKLDFLLVTETWMSMGDTSPFSELVPSDCSFLNCPRLSGRGGGLASVFKSNFCRRSLKTEMFSSFEVLLFLLNMDQLAIAVVYCPPKPNKDFLNEFANFLGDIVLQYDRLSIAGDFNIHICCESNSLAKDFTNLTDSLDFTQVVNGPTHKQGHTLDLVLLHGISICELEILDLSFSDHMPVTFTCSFPNEVTKTQRVSQQIRTFSPSSSDSFSFIFNEACQMYGLDSLSNLLNVDEHLMLFNSISN